MGILVITFCWLRLTYFLNVISISNYNRHWLAIYDNSTIKMGIAILWAFSIDISLVFVSYIYQSQNCDCLQKHIPLVSFSSFSWLAIFKERSLVYSETHVCDQFWVEAQDNVIAIYSYYWYNYCTYHCLKVMHVHRSIIPLIFQDVSLSVWSID